MGKDSETATVRHYMMMEDNIGRLGGSVQDLTPSRIRDHDEKWVEGSSHDTDISQEVMGPGDILLHIDPHSATIAYAIWTLVLRRPILAYSRSVRDAYCTDSCFWL